jgi:hypothetical protein
MTTDTGKVLHFRNCTSNCSNNSRVLELSQTLSSNPCSQKNELKFFIMVLVNPTYHPSFAQMEKTAHVRQDPQVTGTAWWTCSCSCARCVCSYMCVSVHMLMHVGLRVNACGVACVCMCVCEAVEPPHAQLRKVWLLVYVSKRVCTSACPHVYRCACECMCVWVCVHVCTCAYVCAHICMNEALKSHD